MKNDRKPTICIIGGGVAGLAAGIYAQKNGFDSVIYEQHTVAGGQCTSWHRKGYLIDNCVHWLTGTNPEKDIYKVWCDVGVLGPNIEIIQPTSFMQVEMNEQTLNLWQDVERLHTDLLALSPEDAPATEEFIQVLKTYGDVMFVALKPSEQLNLCDIWRLLRQMRKLAAVHKKYSKLSIPEYAGRFRHPLIRKFLTAYMPKSYNAASMFYVYATFVSGNGALPRGGSLGMIERMQHQYEQLGGTVRTRCKAVKIEVNKRQATAVRMADNGCIVSDFVICTCDPSVLFNQLLDRSYIDKFFSEHYTRHDRHPLYSSVNLYYGVEHPIVGMPESIFFETEPYPIANKQANVIFMKNFDYEPTFAPTGKSLLQVLLMQYEEDFEYWRALYENDLPRYKAEKARLATDIMQRIEQRFPEVAEQMETLEVVTPMSYHRLCGAYKGAYMSFIITPGIKKMSHSGRLLSVKNLYLAGQWLQPPGGLPNALVTGRFAIQRLCKSIHRKFVE